MTLPCVLITGFPDSGTSFVANLVAELGFSPGKIEDLKEADSHNRWGYWEHMPISQQVRAIHDGPFRYIPGDDLPYLPYDYELSDEIARIAEEDNVEVYKDCSLPWTYRLFDSYARIILIRRDWQELSASPGLAYLGYEYSDEELRAAWVKYHLVARSMFETRDCLVVWYHQFGINFKSATRQICDFLLAEYHPELMDLWRPRHK